MILIAFLDAAGPGTAGLAQYSKTLRRPVDCSAPPGVLKSDLKIRKPL